MEKIEDYKDPEVLRRMYWDEGKSAEEMADELYCSTSTIRKWMQEAGIPRRKCAGRLPGNVNYRDKQVLQGLVDQGLSTEDIARMSNVTPNIITRWKRRHGIRYGTAASQDRWIDVGGRMMTITQIAEAAGVAKSTIFGRIERGWRGEELLKPRSEGNWVRGRKAALLKQEGGHR